MYVFSAYELIVFFDSLMSQLPFPRSFAGFFRDFPYCATYLLGSLVLIGKAMAI